MLLLLVLALSACGNLKRNRLRLHGLELPVEVRWRALPVRDSLLYKRPALLLEQIGTRGTQPLLVVVLAGRGRLVPRIGDRSLLSHPAAAKERRVKQELAREEGGAVTLGSSI